MFKKESALGTRAISFIALSLLLIFADHHNENFHKLRSMIAIIITPVQYVVNFPIDAVSWSLDSFSSKKSLIKENAALKAKLSLLNAKLQKQSLLKSENAQLRALLASSSHLENKVSAAELLAISIDPFVHQVILNKGKKEGLFVGQPVLDATGVIGQVIQVGQLTSRVMLITDSHSAIPVQIKRNGLRAIASGFSVSNNLKLENITKTMDVKKGDKVITSGLGQRYPFGYPVGTIISVKQDPGKAFTDVIIKPAAHLDRGRLVLLVWTPQKLINTNTENII